MISTHPENEIQIRKANTFRWILVLLYSVFALAFIINLILAFPYYTTPLSHRPFHPGYAVYRPAGTHGLIFGVLGSAFMLILLLYSLKRRTRIFDGLGSTRQWLEVHIFFGVMGPFFILLHTSFKLSGLVSISFWSMVGVAVSGAFGRYLYNQIPRNIEGHELTLKDCEAENRRLSDQITQSQTISENDMDKLMERFDTGSRAGRFWLLSLIQFQIQLFSLSRSLERDMTKKYLLNPESSAALMLLFKKKMRLQLRVRFLNRVQNVFHYWHVLHRPFALVMYVIMLLHIGIALSFGISLYGVFH